MKTVINRSAAVGIIILTLMALVNMAEARPMHPEHNATPLPEQQEKADKMHDAHWKAVEPLYEQLRVAKAELYTESIKPNPDTKKIAQLSQQIGILKGEIKIADITFTKQLKENGLLPQEKHSGKIGRGIHHKGNRSSGHGSMHGDKFVSPKARHMMQAVDRHPAKVHNTYRCY